MRNKKGQAAMEFLTTYGWAFLVIIVAVAGLGYFGVFDFSRYLQTSCSLDGKIECGESFAVDSINEQVQLQLKNNNMQTIEIVGFNIIEKGVAEGGSTTNKCEAEFGNIVVEINQLENDDNEVSGSTWADITADVSGEDLEACGISNNVGKKKKFLVEVEYILGGSEITQVAAGSITTAVQ